MFVTFEGEWNAERCVGMDCRNSVALLPVDLEPEPLLLNYQVRHWYLLCASPLMAVCIRCGKPLTVPRSFPAEELLLA